MPANVASADQGGQKIARETAYAVITRTSHLHAFTSDESDDLFPTLPRSAMLQKTGFRNVRPDSIITRELVKRLNRVKHRIATLTAEAEMIERMLADAEKFAVVPRLKLRKNSQGKWTVRGQIRRHLEESPDAVKAQVIYDALKGYDPSLNASTFRSHLKRMVDDGIVRQEGQRGHYRLVRKLVDEPRDPLQKPRRVISNRQV